MSLSSFQMANQVLIASEIVFFNIFGLFGNLNFIVLTATKAKLKSKSCESKNQNLAVLNL